MFSSFSRNIIPIQPEMKKYIMESTEKSMEKYRQQTKTNSNNEEDEKRFRNIPEYEYNK